MTRTWRDRVRLSAGLLLAVLAGRAVAQPPPPADLVLRNGHVLTVDARDTVAAALAVRDGRIVAVGADSAVRPYIGRGTRVIDLHGRTATPGLIDTHAHLLEGGLDEVYAVALSGARSIADIRRLVADRVRTLKPGEWVTGSGWDEGKLTEARYVHASDLDDVAPANPVWLEHTTGHYGVANSRALALAGIGAETPDPTAGTIDRDAQGRPTGVLKEAATDRILKLLPAVTSLQRRTAIREMLTHMGREGMTGIKDPSIDDGDWAAYASLAATHQLTAHVCVLWAGGTTIEQTRALLARLATLPRPPQTATGGDLMSCGVKLYLDGSGGARTAWVYDDWHRNSTEIDAGNHGYPLIDPEVYRAQVRLIHGAGVHVGTHAIGDRAIDWAVDTYDQVLSEAPKPGLRHSIIHANIPSDHAIGTMARLQREHDAAYPEAQGPFIWWIGDTYAGTFGPQRAARLNPFHSYLEHGVRWGGGSDYPVTPLPARYGLWSSVARETLQGTYGRHPFGVAESVDVHTALRSYTIWAAHQLFIDDEAGSLESGKSADIAVWDRNPYDMPAAALHDLTCELTIFRGRVVYEAKRRRGR